MKPRVGGNGHSVDKLNEDYLQTRNATANAKLRLHELKVAEQERRLLPVAFIHALLGDALSQLRQHMLSVPMKFWTTFRWVDESIAREITDWLRDDIHRALTRASEIQPALDSVDPFKAWHRDHGDDDKTVANQKRTEKGKSRKRK